uniref:Uncharacterized protein n=1 Tax=Salix viminalis TaxID=40686 RepID=A0A6N2NE32_SALVM
MVVEVFPLWWIGYWIIRSWLLPIVLFSAIFVWFLAIIFLLWVHGYAIVQMRLVYWFGRLFVHLFIKNFCDRERSVIFCEFLLVEAQL